MNWDTYLYFEAKCDFWEGRLYPQNDFQQDEIKGWQDRLSEFVGVKA